MCNNYCPLSRALEAFPSLSYKSSGRVGRAESREGEGGAGFIVVQSGEGDAMPRSGGGAVPTPTRQRVTLSSGN